MQSKKLITECNSETRLAIRCKGNMSCAKTKVEVRYFSACKCNRLYPQPKEVPPQVCALIHCDIVYGVPELPLVYTFTTMQSFFKHMKRFCPPQLANDLTPENKFSLN